MKARSLVIAAALALVSSVAFADSDNSLHARAQSSAGGFVAATLCTDHGFDCETAPVRTDLAVLERQTATALDRNEITVARAKAVYAGAGQVRTLLNLSRDSCAQDNKTGKCTKDEARARALLKQAKARLAQLR